MYSVVILTLNEEKALPDCLRSLAMCEDIVVLDSGSNDRTIEIAKAAGARVVQRPFDNFAGQHNFAQQTIAFQNEWVLHLDADERMTAELHQEAVLATTRADVDGFRVAPRMIFQGHWIPHCTDYPAFQARLVRAPVFRFVQVGHGQREDPSMKLENLHSGYLHDISIYGEDAWIEKHRGYAKAEAANYLRLQAGVRFSTLFSSEKLTRRRALKRLSFSLPFRGACRFFYQYFLRLGFLDGIHGLRYCILMARYEGFISKEIKAQKHRV
ncbi:MAG TPA: glycosyltransferase family 2 protein [Opitutaceae bacterium]|jgi:glycosyltransferase involved in cell wall biosynthesis|nr:glycosyltransferase family 2 protein [Opitutaceae bacterium]